MCFNGGEIETFSDGTVFTCPPPELICSRNTSIIETQLVPPVCKNFIIMKFKVYKPMCSTQCVMILVPLVCYLTIQHIVWTAVILYLYLVKPPVCAFLRITHVLTVHSQPGEYVLVGDYECVINYEPLVLIVCSLCCWVQSMYWSKQLRLSGMWRWQSLQSHYRSAC